MRRSFAPLLLALVTALIAGAAARLSAGEPDYVRDIKPVLKQRCFACHSGLKQEGGLRLDAADLIFKGGDSGAVIVAGKSDTSELLKRITSTVEAERMPQEGTLLTAAEVQTFRDWIDAGAKHPDEPPPPDPFQHWSFVPPLRPPVPAASDRSALMNSANPIDRFIAAKQEKLGLIPVASADKHTLLRRVTIDLVGLPPTPAEIAEFLADESPDAYEKVVDRLLASPRYGERWGRHWMDVWRYSDWDGYGAEIRESQPHLWRWRDWIVESVNADKPYDRMIAEMLAGDELAPDDPATVRATGFLARNYHKFSRSTWMENTVEHTGKAFLGLTLNCARCHDHKYDPLAQREYYQWRAVFEPYDVRIDPVPGQADPAKDGLARVFDAKPDAPTYLFERGNEKEPDTEHPLAATLPRIFGGGALATTQVDLPVSAWYPAVREQQQADLIAAKTASISDAKQKLKGAQEALTQTESKLAEAAAVAKAAPELPKPPAAGSQKTLSDNFAKRDEERWSYGKGAWEYNENRLRQTDGAGQFCLLTSNQPHPADFLARVKFTIRGGDSYRSVGLAFDLTDNDNFNAFYLTALAGGPGSVFLHRVAGADDYPEKTRRKFPVELNQPQEVHIAVRGTLANVWVNGKLMYSYKLPRERPLKGKVALWTYHAAADFQELEIEELSAAVKLLEPHDLPATPGEGASEAELKVKLAELRRGQELATAQLAAAEAELASIQARAAADRARYATPPSDNAGELQKQAVLAERAEKLAAAKVKHLAAQHAKSKGVEASAAAEELAKLETAVAEADKAVQAAAAASQDSAGDYAPLGSVYPKLSTGRRLALARMIGDRKNPLTARVAVNHLWLRHFGAPLVPTIFDFGHNGKPPTNPELLDWLAVELMEQRWRFKPLHRLIVTSRTYQLQSNGGAQAARNTELDRDNLYLWRMNTRRLEAEAVRDAVLTVSNRLDLKEGGPDLDPATDADVPRRSVYFRHTKEKRVQFLAVFDQANVSECYRRDETIVPQQALAMANSALVGKSAALLTDILEQQCGTDASTNESFIAAAFLRVLGRPCSTVESERCATFLADQAALPGTTPRVARESLVHTLLNHHDFVTVK